MSLRFLSLSVFFVLFSRSTLAADPSVVYRVLYTPHFEIIFRDHQRDLAKRYALAAEQAYELLQPIFKEGPDVTPIFIKDDTDASNGMAAFLPYPIITVNPVLPGALDSIDDYGDWPFEMIAHEYTHILNMYPAHGIYAPFKYLFGSVLRPNAILPKWYLEGLAVNLESRLSDHGRLRAPETFAYARALEIGHRLDLENIAKINEQELGTWPYGNRPYTFGGWWWSDVQEQKGLGVIETWNQNFSRRIPFLLNGPMREQTGKSAAENLDATIFELQAEAGREVAALKKDNLSAPVRLVDENGEQRVFAISPSGDRLLYFLNHPHLPGSPITGTEAKLKTRTSPAQPFIDVQGKRLFKSVGTTRARWLNDNLFVFDQIDISDPYYTFRDLYLYDLEKDQTIRLTKRMRAEQPSPSPRGNKIVFIKNDGGRNHLALLELDGTAVKKVRYLAHANLQQRLSGPEFINEEEIVFALRQRGAGEKLYVMSLKDRKIKPWAQSPLTSAQNPRATAKGLLVSDDHTHVRNIYLIPYTGGRAQAVTNTLTHVEVADFDPERNELVFSELTPQGNRLMSEPLTVFKPATLERPKLPPPPVPQTKKIQVSEESYQPIRYLLPHYWIPFVYSVEDGMLFQGSTTNSDPAGINTYSLAAQYDTVTRKPAYGASYMNASFPLNFAVDYAHTVSYLGASRRTVVGNGANLNFSDPAWPFNSTFWRWNLGGAWTDTTGAFNRYKRLGPGGGLTYNRMDTPINTWGGWLFSVSHQEYLAQANYLAYGRSYVRTALKFPIFGASKVFIQARAAFAPKMPTSALLDLGDRSIGGNYMVNLTNSDFLLRGYPSGQFVGRKILNANFEYSLPIWELAKGAGTFPVFLKALEAVAFADAMSVDGAGYRTDKKAYFASSLNRYFMGTGAELRLSATGAYHLPFTLTFGGYYGINKQFGGGFTPFIGFGYNDLGALSKTP